MKIVITGALGHIGSRLIRYLPELFPKAEIVMIDNLLTQRYVSLFKLPASIKYHFFEKDICDADLLTLFRDAHVVVHLAAITHPNKILTIEKMNEVNVGGTERVTKACQELQIPLLFISTTNVYSKKEGLVDESATSSDLVPQSPYAISKRESEIFIQSRKDLKFTIFRFGTLFGFSPGIQFQTAVQKFCWQAFTRQPVTVWKTALHQMRPYLDLEDAVRAIGHVLQNELYHSEVYNAVTTHQSVQEILDTIRRQIPKLKTQFVESPLMNNLCYEVCRKKFEKRSFQFKGKLEKGIQSLLENFPDYSMDSEPSEPSVTLR